MFFYALDAVYDSSSDMIFIYFYENEDLKDFFTWLKFFDVDIKYQRIKENGKLKLILFH